MLTEYNERQFGLMRELIQSYEKKEASLGQLVKGIEGLLDAVDLQADSKEKLKSAWGDLETVYAVSLDRGSDENLGDGVKIVGDALRDFKAEIDKWSPNRNPASDSD